MTIDSGWDSLVEKLVGSLKTSEKAQIKSNQEENVAANKQLKDRILLSLGGNKKTKTKQSEF